MLFPYAIISFVFCAIQNVPSSVKEEKSDPYGGKNGTCYDHCGLPYSVLDWQGKLEVSEWLSNGN